MATTPTGTSGSVPTGRLVVIIAFLVLLGAIALDTKVVRIGSDEDFREQAFDPDRFGQDEFPRIRDIVLKRAPDAATLVADLASDKKAAIENYGTMAGAFPVLSVSLTGTVGDGRSGTFNVSVDDLPEGITIRVQTGPAINGTELRDFPGDIAFGAFTNQIEYQDAGSGINRAMSAEVLADLDRDSLTGQTISVTGAFKLINPKNWLITPVALEVK
ncbi:MAG: DUF2291 domain-containing protein [Alphaproteobacteria bacterium]|nr:DUF2291 domain-containing protein [Alphaproteobacteria bacterium]